MAAVIGHAEGRGRTSAPPWLDHALLALVSCLLHLWVFLWLQQPADRPPPETEPRVVELTLLRPAPPPAVQTPAPPPPPKPVVAPKPAPPKPVAKPAPRPKPQPRPKPAVAPPPVVNPAPSAAPVQAVAPVATQAPPAEPVYVPATRAASTRNPKPEYPMIAKRRGWQGTVLLEVEVKENGRPGSVKVRESSGREILDASAMRTVRLWLFNPATRDGRPVSSLMTLSIVFKLER